MRFKLPRISNIEIHGQLIEKQEGQRGYRIYEDGYCEQWGLDWNPTFPKRFKDTNYSIMAITRIQYFTVRITGKTVNGATFEQWQTAQGSFNSTSCYWFANGYLEEGQYSSGIKQQYDSYKKYLYFYVGQYTQSAIEQTAGITSEQLNDKISKTDASDKALVVGWGMPDYSAGISISTSNQTAPKNGWLIGHIWFSGSNVYLSLYVDNVEVEHSPWSNGAWGSLSVCVPIKAGQVYCYNGNGATEQNHLYYYPNN